MKKRFALLLALLAMLFVVSSCETPCQHTDIDKNEICDVCGNPYKDPNNQEQPGVNPNPDPNQPYEFTTPVRDSLKLSNFYYPSDHRPIFVEFEMD